MYWIGADGVGARFRDALAARARDGLKVLVIHDAVGSLGINAAWWEPLTSCGRPRRRVSLDLALRSRASSSSGSSDATTASCSSIDGVTGFTGGINLAAPWLTLAEGGAGWRDDMIEVRGEASQEIRTLFFRTWRRLTSRGPAGGRSSPHAKALAPRLGAREPVAHAAEHAPRVRRCASGAPCTASTSPTRTSCPTGACAPRSFAPCERGARVRVLIPARSDVPVVQFASEALFDTLLRHGVELWILPGTMLHAKTAIVDDEFTTIGSYNLDERSWRKNLEINLAVQDERLRPPRALLVRARPRRRDARRAGLVARAIPRPPRLRVGLVRDAEALVNARREVRRAARVAGFGAAHRRHAARLPRA